MKCNRMQLVFTLILLLMAATILGACANSSPASSPAGATTILEVTPLPNITPTNKASRPDENLPPPLIITIPADQFDITVDGVAAAAGAVSIEGEAAVDLVQFDDGLPPEVDALLERIYRGEYPIDTTGQTPGALPATFTYSDMNGDGIEDLVIILVVGPGDYSNITAGTSQGHPVIQIIPRPEPGTVVEGLSIPIEELLAMAGDGAPDNIGQGSYLITLAPDELTRWSEPVLPE